MRWGAVADVGVNAHGTGTFDELDADHLAAIQNAERYAIRDIAHELRHVRACDTAKPHRAGGTSDFPSAQPDRVTLIGEPMQITSLLQGSEQCVHARL